VTWCKDNEHCSLLHKINLPSMEGAKSQRVDEREGDERQSMEKGAYIPVSIG
jgi:hypothetical protein